MVHGAFARSWYFVVGDRMSDKLQANCLTADREEWFRYLASGGGGDFTEAHCELAAQAMKAIDALTMQLHYVKAERDVLLHKTKILEAEKLL